MKKIEGFENYFVDNQSNVWSNKSGVLKNLKSVMTVYGYLIVALYKDNKPHSKRVHRLVAEAYIPNPENKKEVNHKNGIKDDNRIENLEWNTRAENQQHAFDNGLQVAVKGEDHYKSKLTEQQVLSIRMDFRFQWEIAIDYNISKSVVSEIKSFKMWKHIKSTN